LRPFGCGGLPLPGLTDAFLAAHPAFPGPVRDLEARRLEAVGTNLRQSREPKPGSRNGRRAGRAHARRGRAGAGEASQARQRGSLYAEVTARIIAELEAGRCPWVQPWDNVAAGPGLPRNAASGRTYSGINILLLWGAVIERSYPSQNWLTFAQALDAGGNVRRGEKGVTIVFADRFTPEAEKMRAEQCGDEPKQVPFLKRFTVFNVAQCDGLPERMAEAQAPLPERRQIPVAEAVIAATGADFRIGGNHAFYCPSEDYVAVPPQPAFRAQIDYYRTVLHELGHWTGHSSRLARDLSGQFGSPAYAREELTAELASAYLCASLSIRPTVRHSDYIGSWLEVLKSDDRAIFSAAAKASKAADFLLGFRAEAAAGAAA
jgi:antirestriction protein ArdC